MTKYKSMIASEDTRKELANNCAKLYYAIAMADHNIVPEEIKKLQAAVMDFAFELGDRFPIQVIESFKLLKKAKKESDQCFSEFKEYFLSREHLFSLYLKEILWKTANAIAYSFAKKNKSELILLAKLSILLNRPQITLK